MKTNVPIENNFSSFQQGKAKAFAHYFHHHYKSLRYFANCIVKNEPLAEDIVEESFLKFFEKRGTIQSEETIKGFLYTTVRHACLDKLQQQKTRVAHHKEMAHAQEKFQSSTIEDMIRTETLSIVLKAMEALPAATKKVFQMHFIEGKTYDEISGELGKSKETIRKQKQQGLILLKGKLLPIFVVLIHFFF